MTVKHKGISDPERQFNVLVGQRILRARKALGISAKQLADTVGISDTQVYWYEVGQHRCPPFVLNAFARRLKVSLRDLVPNTTYHGKFEKSDTAEGKLF